MRKEEGDEVKRMSESPDKCSLRSLVTLPNYSKKTKSAHHSRPISSIEANEIKNPEAI
jgi:hypothetical protein